MARKRRYLLPVIEAFRRQLRYANPEVLRKQALAAESLVFEIARDRVYPNSWVVWRITGFRPENKEFSDTILNGDDLRHDLAVFIQELAADLEFVASDRPGGAVATAEAAARLGVSVRTLQRWRNRGLPLIPIRFNDGTRRRGCYLDTLERFAATESRLVENARKFGRVRADEREQLREEVHVKVAEGSLETKAISDVAARAGRSAGTVRRVASLPGSKRIGTRTARRIGLRAHDWRIEVQEVANRLNRSESTMRRLTLEVRAERVIGLMREDMNIPTSSYPDADLVFAAAGALDGFPESLSGLVAHEWLTCVRNQSETEKTDSIGNRIAALHFLNARARRNSEGLSGRPGAKVIDEIERDLGWSALLLERSVLGIMGEAVRRFEQSVSTRLDDLSPKYVRLAFDLLFETCSQSILVFDPGRKSPWHELHRSVGLAVARAVASHPIWRDGVPSSNSGTDEVFEVYPDSLQFLPVDLRAIIGPVRWWRTGAGSQLDSESQTLLMRRHGFDVGDRPRSMKELGKLFGISPTHLQSKLLIAEHQLRKAAIKIT